MKEITYRGDKVFSVGDWQDGTCFEGKIITVGRYSHANTNKHIYLKDKKYDTEDKELRQAVHEAVFLGHIVCLQEKPILIHCGAGMSRSVLISSLMLYAHDQRKIPAQFQNIEEAYQHILKQYPQADVLEGLKESMFSVIKSLEKDAKNRSRNEIVELAKMLGVKVRETQ